MATQEANRVSRFLCINASDGTTIYPAVWDGTGEKLLWCGKGIAQYEIQPSKSVLSSFTRIIANSLLIDGRKHVDLQTISPAIADGATIVLGCYVVDQAHPETYKKDRKNTKTYAPAAPAQASGTFIGNGVDGVFQTDPIDTPLATTFEAQSFPTHSNVLATVAFLRSVADLIAVGA